MSGLPATKPRIHLVQHRADASKKGPEGTEPPPIHIRLRADGRLILESDDTRALDELEELLAEMAPPRQDHKMFRLKYAYAYTVSLNLEDFFKEEEDEKPRRRSWYDYYYGSRDTKTKEPVRLSKRRPLKFIADADTNSICVQGADPGQLRQIEELIEFYDQPEPTDSENIRITETIPIRYSTASAIEKAVKDVYRDLLSKNDKAFAGKKGNQNQERVYIYDSYGSDGDSKTQKAPRFDGLLSTSADDVSNTLTVSAPKFLFTRIEQMIRDLDEAAKPKSTVVVVPVGGVHAPHVQKVLAEMMADAFPNSQKSKKNGKKADQNKKPQPNKNGATGG